MSSTTQKRVRSVKLRPVTQGFNKFCGPAAVSILTGMDTDQAAKLIRDVTGRRAVRGTYSWEINKALNACGILLHSFSLTRGVPISLAKWHKQARKSGWFKSYPVWLIAAGRHWQVVSARQYVCGKSVDIVSICDPQVKRRARVTQAYAVILAS